MNRYFHRSRTLIERDGATVENLIGVTCLEKDLNASRWVARIDETIEVVA